MTVAVQALRRISIKGLFSEADLVLDNPRNVKHMQKHQKGRCELVASDGDFSVDPNIANTRQYIKL